MLMTMEVQHPTRVLYTQTGKGMRMEVEHPVGVPRAQTGGMRTKVGHPPRALPMQTEKKHRTESGLPRGPFIESVRTGVKCEHSARVLRVQRERT